MTTFQQGFRNPIGPIGGIAGADVTAENLSIRQGAATNSNIFTLNNAENHWVFYRLNYVISYSAEGHAATGPHYRIMVVKLLDDPELLADAWRVELALALAATEIGNIAIAGTGFDVEDGIAFPVGVDAKLLAEETTNNSGGFAAGSFNAWNARIHVTVLAREVSP